MLPRYRRVHDPRPQHQADELERLGDRGGEARGRVRRGRTPARTAATPTRTKPISAVARNGRLHQMRLRLSIFCTVRQLSANDGTVSSVAMTSSLAPIA